MFLQGIEIYQFLEVQMIRDASGFDDTLLRSQFLSYDPHTGSTSQNFSKLPSVVFLEDPGTTAVVHRLCRECLSAYAPNPSCLLLGEYPHGMEFRPEEIPGWENLPDHLRILGADKRQKSRKTEQIMYMQLESQRIQETFKQIALHDQTMQAIAKVLRECETEKTDQQKHIRVDLLTYEQIHAIYDSFIEQNSSIASNLAEIDRQTDDIALDAFEEKEAEERNQDLLDTICKLSNQFSRIFILWPDDLIRARTKLFQNLRERQIEYIVLTLNPQNAAEAQVELHADPVFELTIETVWEKVDKAFDHKTGRMRPAKLIEEFPIHVRSRSVVHFSPEDQAKMILKRI